MSMGCISEQAIRQNRWLNCMVVFLGSGVHSFSAITGPGTLMIDFLRPHCTGILQGTVGQTRKERSAFRCMMALKPRKGVLIVRPMGCKDRRQIWNPLPLKRNPSGPKCFLHWNPATFQAVPNVIRVFSVQRWYGTENRFPLTKWMRWTSFLTRAVRWI